MAMFMNQNVSFWPELQSEQKGCADNDIVYENSFIAEVVTTCRRRPYYLFKHHLQFRNTLYMTRCDYDVVFYRVFCVTLLAIAFTFTVILTNVFIDIDGLLANKKGKHDVHYHERNIRDEFTSEATETDILTDVDSDDSYRTKRSIETQSFLFHIKNPKIKSILANRLTTLLEELETEESTTEGKPKPRIKEKETRDVASEKTKQLSKNKDDDNLLHLTMHNILLQGIIGHMDLSEVYKRIHVLMKSMTEKQHKVENLRISQDKTTTRDIPEDTSKNSLKQTKTAEFEVSKTTPKSIEESFFEELVNCNDLHDQVKKSNEIKETTTKSAQRTSTTTANPSVFIKTVIDIKAPLGKHNTKGNDTITAKENIKSLIEIIYNGRSLKFSHPDEKELSRKPIENKTSPLLSKKVITETTTPKVKKDLNKIPKSFLNKFVEEYFKHFPNQDSKEIKENFEVKRLKRHVKIKYENGDVVKNKQTKKKADDDELYVEIETHFDSKGLKGEKKKKLIRNLIEKIQKAIHSDMDGKYMGSAASKKKSIKQVHFRKRAQDPLEHVNHVLVNKYSVPIDSVVHRRLDPISKTITLQESSPQITSQYGEEWRKAFTGPGFLTATKAINSAEMSEVDVDYSKVLNINGVSQRIQRPLNTDFSEETMNSNSYYDLGDMKFFIKDIDGSGFSVGFNQYVDEPPDADTIKLFTGLENVIKTYHQNFDGSDPTTDATNIEERNIDSSISNRHIIMRRSVNKKRDFHANEYKIIYNEDFMPFDSYHDIFQPKKSKIDTKFRTKKHLKDLPLIVDENIFEKNLNPAEIFGLANLLERKKRSVTLKKISSLKNKIKLNRYLNSNGMNTKRIFLNKKRNKRQINKIRIIATDMPNIAKHSDENVFVVSDENVFADRAIVKEVETADAEPDKQEENEYVPFQPEENISPNYVTKIFDGRSRHNALMAKYPHIFMEEITRSGEDYIPENPALLFGKLPSFSKVTQNLDMEKLGDKYVLEPINDSPMPIVPNITEFPQIPQDTENNPMSASKPNYKVTVKIVPKNLTGLNSGFKEIHTSINKRFNKNGLLYSSLVNVSEISKVVKLNKTKEDEFKVPHPYATKKVQDQQAKVQMLLKQHAQHISEQLNRLNQEKSKIESYIDDENNNTEFAHIDFIDMGELSRAMNNNPENNIEFRKFITQNMPETTTVISTTEYEAPTTTTTAHPIIEHIKKNILSTIERNENLTDQILKKIDRNTEILETFLRKLSEKILVTTDKPEILDENATKYAANAKGYTAQWNPHITFGQNGVPRKNDSHITIPFLYAYQQPLLAKDNKRDNPMANVVYHGHVHTNTIHPKEVAPEKSVQVRHQIPDSNQTRFFIDDLENDYKVIQVGDVNKRKQYNMVNGTRSNRN